MAYPVSKLIATAYNYTGIVTRDYEEVSQDQYSEALFLLNAFISFTGVLDQLIPYYEEYDLTQVADQEKYNVPDLVEIEFVTFYIDSPSNTVRVPCSRKNRTQFFGEGRVDGFSSIPFSFMANRVKGGTDIYFYFKPDQNYFVKIWGKFKLSSVALETDLSLLLDDFYIDYLSYELAFKVAAVNNSSMQPQAMSQLMMYRNTISAFNTNDYEPIKKSFFGGGRSGITLWDAWIGKGMRP